MPTPTKAAGNAALFCQAAFQSVGLQHILVDGDVPAQVQDFALAFPELHEVPVGPFLQSIEVPLDGRRALWCINRSCQFCIFCKLDYQLASFSSQAAGGHSATWSIYPDFHPCKEGMVPRQPDLPRTVSWVPLGTEQVCVTAALFT